MPKLLTADKKHVLVMCTACAQASHNPRHLPGITSQTTHKTEHKNISPVHNPHVYTPTSGQTTPSNRPALAQPFRSFYRLIYKVMPSIHRAYKYDHNLNLMKI